MSDRPPYQPWYEGDFWTLSVRAMHWLARLFFRSMLQGAWDLDPPGRIPNEPAILQALAGNPPDKEWEEQRETVLSKFDLSRDGKYFTNKRQLAELAKAREKRRKQEEKSRKGGKAKADKHLSLCLNSASGRITQESDLPNPAHQPNLYQPIPTQPINNKTSARSASPDSIFAKAYACYPRRVKPRSAETAWGHAVDREAKKRVAPLAEHEDFIFQRVMHYAACCMNITKAERKFIPHMSSWLNQDRFLDDPSEWEVTRQEQTNGSGISKAERRNADISEATRRVFDPSGYALGHDAKGLADETSGGRAGDVARDAQGILRPRVPSGHS